MKKTYCIYLLMLHCIIINSLTSLHASGYERYQQAYNDVQKRIRISDERLLEHKIIKLHPQSPYTKLTPRTSYAKLSIDAYATDEQVEAAYTKSKKNTVNDLMIHTSINNIKLHREIKASYIDIIKNLEDKNRCHYYSWQNISKEPFIKDHSKLPVASLEALNKEILPFVNQAKIEKEQASVDLANYYKKVCTAIAGIECITKIIYR